MVFAFIGNIFDPTFENDIQIFKDTIMGDVYARSQDDDARTAFT